MPERAAPRRDDPFSAYFADALRDHRLVLQACLSCGTPRWPAGAVCPACWSEAAQWRSHPGTGEVTSFVWYFQPQHARFSEVPYNVSLVRLDDGPVIVSNVVGCAFGELSVGDRVTARFEDQPSGFTVLLFEREVDR